MHPCLRYPLQGLHAGCAHSGGQLCQVNFGGGGSLTEPPMPDHIFLLSPFGRTSRGGSRAQVPAALSFSHHGGRGGARSGPWWASAARARDPRPVRVLDHYVPPSSGDGAAVEPSDARAFAHASELPDCARTALEAGARAAAPPTTPRSPLRRAYLSAPLRPPPYHFTASTRLVDRKVYKNIWKITILGRVLARVLVLSFK